MRDQVVHTYKAKAKNYSIVFLRIFDSFNKLTGVLKLK
jgi:pyruvate/oxaloacetate carboxyltransferase